MGPVYGPCFFSDLMGICNPSEALSQNVPLARAFSSSELVYDVRESINVTKKTSRPAVFKHRL